MERFAILDILDIIIIPLFAILDIIIIIPLFAILDIIIIIPLFAILDIIIILLFAILDMINDHDPAVQGEELEGDVEKLLRKPIPRLSLVRESSFLH